MTILFRVKDSIPFVLLVTTFQLFIAGFGAGQGAEAATPGPAPQQPTPQQPVTQQPVTQYAGQKNSTEKIRVRPSQQSLRAGSGVVWTTNYDRALVQAKATGKPIFWYVPSVTGTFMDRQTEVDRYMLAGPFSWPANIKLLNHYFVPLKCVPSKLQAAQFGIEVYKFVEPGFLIVAPDEKVLFVADRLTTTNPQWFFAHVASVLDGKVETWKELADPDGNIQLDDWLGRLSSGGNGITEDELQTLQKSAFAEHRMIAAMSAHRRGDQRLAVDVWAKMANDFPEHPLAWKAACESQRIGPFVRGFEVFGDQIRLEKHSPESGFLTSAAVPGSFDDSQLWTHGIEFLLSMQDKSGGFFDSDYDFGGTDSLPNVYVAVTSLVGMALLEASEMNQFKDRDQLIMDAVRRAVEFVGDERNINFDDRDEILWAQAYRIRLLARAIEKGFPEATKERLQAAVEQLESLQLNTGTWFHEYANAFVTATALVSLREANRAGAVVDKEKVNRGLQRLENQRLGNGAYPYATRRPGQGGAGSDRGTDRDMAASGGRISICELARYVWDEVDSAELSRAVELSLKYHELLEKALKYDNHTSTYAYGGFFFWYDMQARSEAIDVLPAGQVQVDLGRQQKEIVRRLPEIDGCFVDSHELGRCYGTAMALLSLGRL